MPREYSVPQGAEGPIRARLEHTLYGHWGGRSGYPRFADHLDRAAIVATLHGAADSHEQCPRWLNPFRSPAIRALKRRRMKWYKLSDLNAEIEALGDCLRGRVDIVHFLDGEHGGQFLPRWLQLARSPVRTVATFHQPPDLLDDLLDPAVVVRFDHIVLMSPSQLPYFLGRLPPERVSVILHGVDTDFFRPEPAKRERDGPLRAITVGHWLRDWSLFRAAAERLPEIEFHAVTARETGADELPNVVRHTGLSDEALAELYRATDIAFLPLTDSTANNGLLEGIASGLPTIATDLIATRSYLPGGEAVLIPRGDADATVAALTALADDPDRRRTMGALARQRAEELSWPRVADRYRSLYERLMAR